MFVQETISKKCRGRLDRATEATSILATHSHDHARRRTSK
jgi:hypothetical protein